MSEEPTTTEASVKSGWQLRRQSRWKEAVKICHSVLERDPACGEAWHLLGLLAHDQGNPALACETLAKAVTIEPGQPLHYNNLGVILLSMERYVDADVNFTKALNIDPTYHDARCNLGLALYHQRHYAQAAKCFEEILSKAPNHDAALANLGMTRLALQMYSDAAIAYEKAIVLNQNQPKWHGNLGAAYMRLGDFTKAARCYHRASRQSPGITENDIHRGIALRAAGNLQESIRVLKQVLSENPYDSAAIANLVVALEYTCQWDQLEIYHPLLRNNTLRALSKGGLPNEDPMQNIRSCDDVALNHAVCRSWSRSIEEKARFIAPPFSHKVENRTHRRTRIGYLSYDFRNHPVAHQLFPLFRLHDRRRFHVMAFSMGPNDGSTFRQQIETDSDEFIDISDDSLVAAAQKIYDRKVDILVDLMGHSHHNRMGILALRPAPLQLSYMGFLSTTGANYIDYVVADPMVLPKAHNRFYEEKVLRMPHCYQFNHNLLTSEPQSAQRDAWGLPTSGFVFCCFNNPYKIDRTLFDAWMRILKLTPDAVLWLSDVLPMASDNMRQHAKTMGIDPERLIFSGKLPLEDHLKRLPLADLALDTLRYNGGATTANVLSVGLPLITVKGRHWVSRMSASHLVAAGLPDLVFQSLATYERIAVELARYPNLLLSIRRRLEQNTKTHPLFNSHGYVRTLETGFKTIWHRYVNGLSADHIDLPGHA